jgi:hypothetical protein
VKGVGGRQVDVAEPALRSWFATGEVRSVTLSVLAPAGAGGLEAALAPEGTGGASGVSPPTPPPPPHPTVGTL